MSSAFMTCTGMYRSGAGIGTEITQAGRRPTLRACSRGLTACYVAGVGAARLLSTCVPRTGATTLHLTGATALASVLSTLSLAGSSRRKIREQRM